MDARRGLRILIVTECFWPDIYAVNDITAGLVTRGHDVTVLTGLPDYTTGRIPEEYRHGRNRRQTYRGAEIIRVPTVARRRGPIWRSLSYLSFVVSGWLASKHMTAGDYDVIYVWEVSPVTMAVPALRIGRRCGIPVFLYCMDIWPECVKAMNIREKTLPFRIIHKWSSSIYRRCDHIAVSSTPFFEYLTDVNGVDRSKMSYLPQFGDSRMLNVKPKSHSGSTTEFLFVGNIGKAQNLDCLMHAMQVFKDRNDVHLHMVGGGSEYDRIRELCTALGLDDIVTFYGAKPFEESIEFYTQADACILTLDGSTKIGDTLPGKLQTYMAAGRTVLAAANGAAEKVINESGCGICVRAGDSESFGRALLEYTDHRDKYADCGEKARIYFERNYTEEIHYAALELRLYEMIDSVH